MLELLGDDPEGEGLDSRECSLLCLSVCEDAGQLDDFRHPAAIVLSLDFDFERNQQLITSRQRVYDDGVAPETRRKRTLRISRGAERRQSHS
jgi:hypothetical protein